MKAARIRISYELLSEALGFDWQFHIVNAQMNNTYYQHPTLELIVESEKLDDVFTVKANEMIKEAVIVLHTKHIETEVRPI